MKHIVSFSGGLGSWMAAKRVAEKYGTDNLYLVFTDVLIEDEDLYRFLYEAAENVGGELVVLADGRNPWDVFRDKRYMGNTRTAHCSQELKSKPFEKWLKEQAFSDFVVYLGIDWTEEHRLIAHRKHVKHKVEAPLCDAPYLSKQDVLDELARVGIELPRLYKMGFSHNNCGGGCVKAGQGQWAMLYKEMPEKYSWFEAQQESLLADVATTRPFLRITIDKVLSYVSLKDYREQYLEKSVQIDMFDIGGCGCFLSEAEDV